MPLKRFALLGSLTFLAAAAPPHRAAGPPERPLATGSTFEWQAADHRQPVRLRAGNMHVLIKPVKGEDSVVPIVTVSAPGLGTVDLSKGDTGASDLYDNLKITVGRWDRAGHLFVMLTSYSGGAHCCELLRVAAPIGSRLMAVDFGESDGGIGRRPRDIDGDGRLDFVMYDNSFLYAFSAYADSYAPPTVLNVTREGVVDVSDRRSFAPLFRRHMASAGKACMDAQNEGRNGACAAYVADAARLGKLDQAWQIMLRSYNRHSSWELPPGCSDIHLDGTCPDKAVVHYNSYPDSLRAFLKGVGYIK